MCLSTLFEWLRSCYQRAKPSVEKEERPYFDI